VQVGKSQVTLRIQTLAQHLGDLVSPLARQVVHGHGGVCYQCSVQAHVGPGTPGDRLLTAGLSGMRARNHRVRILLRTDRSLEAGQPQKQNRH
jgi:hypothetical protein